MLRMLSFRGSTICSIINRVRILRKAGSIGLLHNQQHSSTWLVSPCGFPEIPKSTGTCFIQRWKPFLHYFRPIILNVRKRWPWRHSQGKHGHHQYENQPHKWNGRWKQQFTTLRLRRRLINIKNAYCVLWIKLQTITSMNCSIIDSNFLP